MTLDIETATGKLLTVLADTTGARLRRVPPSARLEQDLGITGDDLVEALDAVFGTFHIDAGDFLYRDYVSAEGLGLLGPASNLPRPKPLTVAMLAQAIRDGRWSSSELDRIADQ